MQPKIERRMVRAEVRSVNDGTGVPHIEGHAAVFNQETEIGWFHEIIKPGAFKRALGEKQDVRCLFNHDVNFILGRSKSGTLELSEDDTGLAYRCAPSSSPMSAHVREAIERGDVDGSSFGFMAREDEWRDERDANGKIVKSIRTIIDADLFDVGPVTFPAYDGTDASVRSLWPQGIPESILEQRSRRMADMCECECPECTDGDCADCTEPDCDDENCRCMERSRAARSAAKTKRVDSEDLSADAFLVVVDSDDASTWKLPWKFSTDEKTKSHLRNALARFNQLKGVPQEQKDAGWKKLVRLCREHEIEVSEENAAKLTAEQRAELAAAFAPPVDDQAEALRRKARLIEIETTL